MKTNRLNERGVAHLLLLVLVVAAIGVIGFAGYKVSSKNKTSTKSSAQTVQTEPTVAADSTCVKQLGDKDLCKFANSFKDLDKTSFITTIIASGSSGSGTMKFSQDKSGNSESSFSAEGFNFDVITIGSYIYSKDASGAWVRYPSGSDAVPPMDNPLKDANMFENNDYTDNGNLTYKKIGKENCGSVTCFKYEMTDKSDAGGQYTMWFDTKDYQLRRMLMKNGSDSFDLTISYENVKVSAPAQWKDYKTL